ncbi:MAG: anhydro-N-acetylmuramic acid kinase [Chloroherpetonaceae bacterium]|nr:anhydro-N-acetylmuramic acid kinase [Chloroherpetonaceae bacterium]
MISIKPTRSKRLGLGLLSGTSLDGIDAGLFEINGNTDSPSISTKAFRVFPFSKSLHSSILKNLNPESAKLNELSELNIAIANAFADASLKLLKKERLPATSVDFIGSHGQTFWHDPKGGTLKTRSTFQLGDGSVIASRTGILTVSDFRTAELAFGSEGAPLVPFLDFALYRHQTENRVLINIGGISNVTFLPRKTSRIEPIYFDAGPGNVLIDKAARLHFGVPFDSSGKFAKNGKANQLLLKEFLKEPFYKKRPPKSTGRELFSDGYFERLTTRMNEEGLSKANHLATLTMLTVSTLAAQIKRFILKRLTGEPLHLISIGGGGAKNTFMMELLRGHFPNTRLVLQQELAMNCGGVLEAKAKEAALFALLADAALSGISASMKTPAILGKISLPPVK